MPQSDLKSPSTARTPTKGRGAVRARPPETELETRELLAALRAFRRGDFSVRLPRSLTGIGGEIADDDSGLRLLGGTGVPEGVVGSSANPPAVLDADVGLSEPRDGFTLDGATTATTSNTATAAYSGA